MLRIDMAGEEVLAHWQRVLIWPAERTMFLADLHLGKSDVFRRAGIPIPEGGTLADLQRLDDLVEQFSLERIVLLGDFVHGPSIDDARHVAQFAEWRNSRARLDFVVVAGNHDCFEFKREWVWPVKWAREPLQVGPFVCRHHPGSSEQGYVLCGHLHPVIFLYGSARERARVPVLWLREGDAILPSFGSFTGGAEIEPLPSQSVYAFAAEKVWRVPTKPSVANMGRHKKKSPG